MGGLQSEDEQLIVCVLTRGRREGRGGRGEEGGERGERGEVIDSGGVVRGEGG